MEHRGDPHFADVIKGRFGPFQQNFSETQRRMEDGATSRAAPSEA
jgi:hypothetical protein